MPRSFISERSAELVIVPALIKALTPYYPAITPIFYWTSREGGIMSRNSFPDTSVKLLVLYARRPKVTAVGCGRITVKLNQILFDRSNFLKQYNIPVIAGVPLVDSLQDMVLDVACAWCTIHPEGSETFFEISKQGEDWLSKDMLLTSAAAIAELIDSAPAERWDRTIEIINEMRRSSTPEGRNYYRFMGGDPYKPVYLIVH